MALILASSSLIRRAMLEQAGVAFAVRAPDCDEAAVKQAHDGGGERLAVRLAQLKAASVAAAPDDWVIGADSVVVVDGAYYSKPRDRAEAMAHLQAFSGRTIYLSSGVALARGGAVDWSYGDTARLDVRPLSADFIADYLAAEWPEVSYCAGVFRMEGRGVTLFDQVAGSHFTILGMPLLPLLGALRQRGAVAA